jgi:multidrug efflux pump subunit AcrB
MARNPVAANLLMFVILVGGFLASSGLKQEVFPAFDLDVITVSVPYPGASPAEVEQGIVLAIEEAVRSVEGVKRVTSVSQEGLGTVSIELLLRANADRVLADVTNLVDRIPSFPLEAERPTIATAGRRQPVISLIISGEQDLETLQALGETAREDLLETPGITQVQLSGVRPLEMSIEVSREALEAYDLTLDGIAQQIRQASVDLPGGEIETAGGEVLVRVVDRRRRAQGFENIVVRTGSSGAELRVGDVATVRDGFQDTDQALYYDGVPAVQVIAFRVGNQTPTDVANAVKAYAAELALRVPEPISISTWNDDSEALRERIDQLVRNAMMGLVLVLILLGLFLNRGLAGWVALGIPISFLGAFLAMIPAELSVNVITLSALIVTLGLVVDDAIVVGENIHSKRVAGMDHLEAAILGAREMAVPVTFSVLTTMVAFAPLLFVPGVTGKIFRLIPIVVIAVLFFSLIESFFILPAHLSHAGEGKPGRWARLLAPVDRAQASVSDGLDRFISDRYEPLLRKTLEARYLTVAVAVALLIVTTGAVAAGLVPFNFFPPIPGDVVTASARLPYGTNIDNTRAVQLELERGLASAIERAGEESVRGVMTRLGSASAGASARTQGSHLVAIEVALVPSEERDFSATDFETWWRDALPSLPGVESLRLSGTSTQGPSAGSAVSVELSSRNPEELAAASQALASRFLEFPSLVNVDNSYTNGKPQLDFRLRDEARGWGLTSTDVARAIRSAFFGAEALREQRGRNEVKVMVRLPEEQRASENDIERLMVGLPGGGTAPLAYVADVTRGRSPTEINREEGRRIVTVSGELAQDAASSRPVIATLARDILPELRQEFPGLETRFAGQAQELNDNLSSLGPMYLVAMLLMFAMIAIPFQSYLQPLVVMSAVPFGIVGAVLGHLIMGYQLSMVSGFGIIALSGIMVNDSLVLVDAVNRYRREGMDLMAAVVAGSARRLRPILLTSLTTFMGLAPLILEKSAASRFLVPMAISLGFGALFVTVIALLVVPSLYVLAEDLRAWWRSSDEALGGEGLQPAAARPARS